MIECSNHGASPISSNPVLGAVYKHFYALVFF